MTDVKAASLGFSGKYAKTGIKPRGPRSTVLGREASAAPARPLRRV